MPSTVEQVHRTYGARGLTVLAITDESPTAVRAWLAAHPISVPVLLDGDGAVHRAWRVAGTPTVFLIGRDGRLVGKAVGGRPWMEPVGRALLEALLQP